MNFPFSARTCARCEKDRSAGPSIRISFGADAGMLRSSVRGAREAPRFRLKNSPSVCWTTCGAEKCLSIRAVDRRDALAAYERQGHKCVYCGEVFEFEQMHADHITPWSKGGKTTPENCQMLCRDCNLKKGAQ